MTTTIDNYTYYYKEGILLRSSRNPKTYERSFEFFEADNYLWKPMTYAPICMNLGKYLVKKVEAEQIFHLYKIKEQK